MTRCLAKVFTIRLTDSYSIDESSKYDFVSYLASSFKIALRQMIRLGMKTKLSVNLNKVALIRNGRGGNVPNLVKFAQDCESYGADGITVHPRPDQRHVRYEDLSQLKEVVSTELNIEGYPSDTFMNEVLSVKPHQCTLVPDPPGVLTSDSGWDIEQEESFLIDILSNLKEAGIRTSLFIDPDPNHVVAAKKVGADRVELYTGSYANQYFINKDNAIKNHKDCASKALSIGIDVNAGHDLSLDNLRFYAQSMTNLKEVSIGHALISDSLYYGISNVINMYKTLLT